MSGDDHRRSEMMVQSSAVGALSVVTPEDWAQQTGERMLADGSTVTHVPFMARQAVVGYQSEFRLRWMATKLHLFTIVLPVAVANGDDLDALIGQSMEYGKNQKGRFRGLQTGVAVMPVLVATTVEPDARMVAENPAAPTYFVFARPVAVDLTAGRTYASAWRQFRGVVYGSWLDERLSAVASTPETPWAPSP